MIIHNACSDVEVNDFDLNDIKGMYGYDLQQNLYPNIQNNDNQTNQNEDGDVTDSNSSDSNSTNNDGIEIIRNEEQNLNKQPQAEMVVDELKGDLESIVQEIENNMNTEIEEFNEIDNNIDNTIQNMEEEVEMDETPIKRN